MKIEEVKTRRDLAMYIGIPLKLLTYILYEKNVNNLYTEFEISKKSRGTRSISAPKEPLMSVLKSLSDKLHNELLDIREKEQTSTKLSQGFEKGKSFITNAQVHVDKDYILNIDLENFFESIHFGRVRGYFEKNRNFMLPNEIATMIAQLTCYKKSLGQGSPTSPVISNLICNILDVRIASLAKKYRLDYTRYVDDLTFSSNNVKFKNNYKAFIQDLESIIKRAGFNINESKTRFDDKFHRQLVTGVVVNKKVNINRTYYKTTRAMAHTLYKIGTFEIDGEKGTINQLEGRFSFINQLSWHNNIRESGVKHNFRNLNGFEKEYQKFLMFKYFFDNKQSLIICEGKTDVLYLKSALRSMHNEFGSLIVKNSNNTYDYKISYLNKTKRLKYFLNFEDKGADTFKNIFNFYDNGSNIKDFYPYMKEFKKLSNRLPSKPVILLFDN